MNKEIDTPPFQFTQKSSINWMQRYGEIISFYILHINSADSSDRYHKSIKQKTHELLSFLNENHIQAQDELQALNDILNQIKSQEILQEPKNVIENENSKIILAEPEKQSHNIGTFQNAYEEYLDFLKRIENIQGNLKEILVIQDYQTKKAEFERLIQKKPNLQEATMLRERMNTTGPDFERNLQENIEVCQIWSQKVKEYLEKYERFVIDDTSKIEHIREMTREMSQIKEERNLLILKEEGLETRILIFEWKFQAKLFMNSGEKRLPQSEIKYWRELLRKAQEGKHKEILGSERYKEIFKQVTKYESLTEQVKEIEEQEKLLIGNDREEIDKIGFKELEILRYILKEFRKCKVLSLREEMFLERILDEAQKIIKEYQSLKESPTFIPMEKFQSIVKRFQKLPIKLPQEIREQILKEERITELLQEVIAKPNFEVAKIVYNEYEGCYLDIPEAQAISRAYNQVEILKTIDDVFEHRRSLDYKEICQIEKQIENFPLDLGPELHKRAKVQVWLIQIDLIRELKENTRIMPEKLIPLQKICEYFLKGHDYLENIKNDDQKMLIAWKNSIKFLKDLIRAIEVFFAKISLSENPQKENNPFSYFIDMEEKLAEIKATATRQKRIFAPESPSILKKRNSPFVDTASTTSQQVESEDEMLTLTKKLKTGEDSVFIVEEEMIELE